MLTSFNGLNNAVTYSYIDVRSNPLIQSLDTLPFAPASMETINVNNNELLVDLSALNNVTEVTKSLIVTNNAALTNLQDLANVTSIKSELRVTDNADTLTIRTGQLPFYVQESNPVIDEVVWLARVKDDPETYTFNVGESSVVLNQDTSLNNLCTGPSYSIEFDIPFTLSALETNSLEELFVLIHYIITIGE